VAYHVQIRRSFRRAWLFNLSEERLSEEILDPWIADRELEIGDQRWEPRDSDLRIIEGPELDGPDLAHGQGWNAAERRGEDVTRSVMAGAPPPTRVSLLAERPGARVLLESGGEVEPALLLEAADALRALAERQGGPSPPP
jgi:hypothetical protein